MRLDLHSFEKAIASLDRALSKYKQNPSDEYVRDSCIQRFEFTYELSHKMLKRYLDMTLPNPTEVEELSFADLIRTGNEKNLLLSDWTVWRDYRKARGTTSHAYDQEKAEEVLLKLPDFLKEAQFLYQKLSEKSL